MRFKVVAVEAACAQLILGNLHLFVALVTCLLLSCTPASVYCKLHVMCLTSNVSSVLSVVLHVSFRRGSSASLIMSVLAVPVGPKANLRQADARGAVPHLRSMWCCWPITPHSALHVQQQGACGYASYLQQAGAPRNIQKGRGSLGHCCEAVGCSWHTWHVMSHLRGLRLRM